MRNKKKNKMTPKQKQEFLEMIREITARNSRQNGLVKDTNYLNL